MISVSQSHTTTPQTPRVLDDLPRDLQSPFIQSAAAQWCLHRCVMVLSVREAGRVQAVILIRSVFVSSSIIHVIILSAKRSHSFYAYNSSMAHFSGLWCKGGETGDIIFSTFPTPFTFSLLWCKNLIFITVLEKNNNDIWLNLYWFKCTNHCISVIFTVIVRWNVHVCNVTIHLVVFMQKLYLFIY